MRTAVINVLALGAAACGARTGLTVPLPGTTLTVDAATRPDSGSTTDAADAGRDAVASETFIDAPRPTDATFRDAQPEVGSCGCDGGMICCGTACVDTQRDLTNCGGCTVVCPHEDICVAGICAAAVEDDYTFPSMGSTVGGPGPGAYDAGALGPGGGGGRWHAGDFVSEDFARSAPVHRLDLSFEMSDSMSGCAVGMAQQFEILVQGVMVGTFAWTTAAGAGTRNVPIVASFAFPAISPSSSNTITLEFEATGTVCMNGGSWNWVPGGTALVR